MIVVARRKSAPFSLAPLDREPRRLLIPWINFVHIHEKETETSLRINKGRGLPKHTKRQKDRKRESKVSQEFPSARVG